MENIEVVETESAESTLDGELNESEQVVEPEKKLKRRRRGSVAPFLSLGEAVDIANRFYEDAGGESFPDLLSGITNNSPGSSTFARKLIALKGYGLVEEEIKGGSKIIKLTDIGFSITAPKSESERAEALRLAFLKIEVFGKLYERFKGRLLPQELFLINTAADYVPREVAGEWISRFKESAQAANLLEERAEGKTLVLETLYIPQKQRQPEAEIINEKIEDSQPQQVTLQQVQPQQAPVSPDVIRMPIALGPGRLAYIELPKDWKPTELKKLLALLNLSLGDEMDINE